MTTRRPFTANVGGTGIQFSFDGGKSWMQPTYTGWTARHCVGVPGPDPGCAVQQGPIGTVPRYDELGLVSDGDPALAFGPRPGPSGFSWANGSRLYVANLTSNVAADFREGRKPTFKGFEAIYVARTDNVESAAAGNESAWMLPVRVSRQSSATFADRSRSGPTTRPRAASSATSTSAGPTSAAAGPPRSSWPVRTTEATRGSSGR